MIDPARARQLTGQSVYVAAALAILVIALLPLRPGAISWTGPDLLWALTFAWVLRRPEQVPVLIVAAVAVVADLLLMKPLGLGAAILVMGTEAARAREHRWREQAFLFEWMRVAAVMTLMALAERVICTVTFVPATLAPLPPLGQDILRLIATVAAYPVVVWLARTFAGLRRVSPAEIDRA